MGRYPTRSALYQDPYLKNNQKLQPFFKQLKSARPYLIEAFPRVVNAYERAVKSSFYGGNPEKLLKKAQKKALRVRFKK